MFGHSHGEGIGGIGVSGLKNIAGRVSPMIADGRPASKPRYIGQTHLAGSVSSKRYAAVASHDLDIGAGVDRHLDLVTPAYHELTEGGAERDLACCGQPRGDGEHVLLRDLALQKPVGEILVVGEPLRER